MSNKKEYNTYIERNSNQDYDEEKERRKAVFIRKKQRIKMIKKGVFGLLIIVAMIAGWMVASVETQVNAILNKMDRDPMLDLSDVLIEEGILDSDIDIINILLVGSDKRASWSETGRSDSTMIATLDLKNKRLKLTSLMRDMYLEIPGYGEDRFNAAYAYGGVKLLYETIAANFGIKLDGYVIVDFAAFKEVINTIGGVEIELTQAEYKYLTTAYKKGSVLEVQPGKNTLNGTQALAYTRIRQDAHGDFGRTARQRNVLQSIFNKAKGMSFTELINLTETMMPYLATDLTNQEIISYMKSVVMLGTTEIDQMRIPIDDSYTQDRIQKKAVLIPDLPVNKEALSYFIFNYDGKIENIEQ